MATAAALEVSARAVRDWSRYGSQGTRASLSLLNGFRLTVGERRVEMPGSAQRLLAFLAITPRPMFRPYVAGTLWLEQPEDRSAGSLRSALWRVHRCQAGLIDCQRDYLCLAPSLAVDLHEVGAVAHRLVNGVPGAADLAIEITALSADLLPDWYDEWLTLEREQFRQLRLHALEALCVEQTRQGRHAQAVLTGLAAVAAEPLRESAQRVLIEAYAAEGNLSESLRQYDSYRRLLLDELGLEPTPQMRETCRSLMAGGRRPVTPA
jgi:DNA-binding SARP family transcriptional activator